MTAIDVVVPSYARPVLLERCLAALAVQTVSPRAIVVVAQRDDASTLTAARAAAGPIRIVPVDEPGVVAALRAGVGVTTADGVAFTDDDAEPAPDWLARIAEHLARPGVGGIGGRDHIAGQTSPARSVVGRHYAFGRTVGDHHLGVGLARPVEILKGVNMAFRVDALALPRAGVLEGRGAECHSEILVCRWATRQGWTLVYDPAVGVAHRVGGALDPSVAADAAARLRADAVGACAANWVIATTALDPGRWPVQVGYGIGFGSRAAPGCGRALIGVLRGEADVVARFGPAVAGQARGARRALSLARHRAQIMVTAAELREQS